MDLNRFTMNTIEQTLNLPPASKNRPDSDALITNLQKALELRQNTQEFDTQRTAEIKAGLERLYTIEYSTQNTLETKKSPETLEQATVAVIKNNFDSFFESEPKRDAFLRQIGVKVNSKDSLVLAQNLITHLIDEGVASFEKSNGVAYYTIYSHKLIQIAKLGLYFPTIRELFCRRETESEKQKSYLTHKIYLETQDRPVAISIFEPVSFESEVVEIEPEIKNKADQKKIKVESKYPDNYQKVTSTKSGLEAESINRVTDIEIRKNQNTQEAIQKTAHFGEKISSEFEENPSQKSSLQRYQVFIKSNLKTTSRLKILGSPNTAFVPEVKPKNPTISEPLLNFVEFKNPLAGSTGVDKKSEYPWIYNNNNLGVQSQDVSGFPTANIEFSPPQGLVNTDLTQITDKVDSPTNLNFWDFAGINFEPPNEPLETVLNTDQKTTISPFDSIPEFEFKPAIDNNSSFEAENYNYKPFLDFTNTDSNSFNFQADQALDLSKPTYSNLQSNLNRQKLESLKNLTPKLTQNQSEFVPTEIKDFSSEEEISLSKQTTQETFESLNNSDFDQKMEANNLVKFTRKESLETGKSAEKEVKPNQTETQAANNLVKFARKEASIQGSIEENSAKSLEISPDSTSTQSQPVGQASPEMASV